MPKTILLADDSLTIRKVVELTFTDTDIRVESVASGSEALERLHSLRPDLILADVGMPEPSGYEVCRQVKRSSRPVPVVLLTGTFEPFDIRLAEECGADAHVTKPFESSALLRRVEELLSAPPTPGAEELESVPAAESATLPDEPAPPESDQLAAELEPLPGSPTAAAQPEDRGGLADSDAVAGMRLSSEELDAIARAVVQRLGEEVLREVAWEVVPDLAATIIRERIHQLEQEVDD